MKVCWYKAVNGRKPRKGDCLPQLTRGSCEACEYYREEEPKRKKAKKEGDRK